MPDTTPNLGLKKPLGNENVSRAAYNENLDIIDASAARKTDLIAHQNAADPHPQYATDTDLAAHATENNVHGATSSSAAGMIVARDSFGRAQVSAPSAAADIARKVDVDVIRADATKVSVMEVRTSDPVSPVVGQHWFRSDL
ncbi:hypothetical protein [Paenibacillus sp. FSL H7-0331]|uniref:hypothetical protein n=1 Tax=Paenibacillus sp. FSL H7-0331 TaxID=1920421 RepID=UPI00096EED98|nr:hypothetical protein [Paenibacillus sp. FSL H7-0331]OMF12345.1 hypothetical protein BK127_23020 [Paenibacillus sp. FSL H7-0331]